MRTASAAIIRASLKEFKILLVDDEFDIVTIMKSALAAYDVTGFSDPKAAYNAMKNNPSEFCILISDVRMPGMSGFELARAAARLNNEIKIVLMTAFEVHLDELRKTLPTCKVDMLLTKPFQIAKLQEVVSQLVAQVGDKEGGASPNE